MGCKNSTPPPQNHEAGTGQRQAGGVSPPAGNGKGQGKGKGARGKGKGKGKGIKINKDSKFQVELSGEWKDYDAEEDGILKRAFLVGNPNAKYHLRQQDYEYSFKNLVQKNLGTGKTRKIRPPRGMTQPKNPLLPNGSMIVISVPEGVKTGQTSMVIDDPNNKGKKITVALPPRARPGAQMAVPVPAAGEDIKDVVTRQRGMSTGAKVATGAAAVGALAVGGIVLGEHLTDGALSSWAEASPELDAAGDWAAGAAEDAADWASGAVEAAGDWGAGAGEWIEGAAEDAGDWGAGAADGAGAWFEGAGESAEGWAADAGDWGADFGDWLGGASEDAGAFVTQLF